MVAIGRVANRRDFREQVGIDFRSINRFEPFEINFSGVESVGAWFHDINSAKRNWITRSGRYLRFDVAPAGPVDFPSEIDGSCRSARIDDLATQPSAIAIAENLESELKWTAGQIDVSGF